MLRALALALGDLADARILTIFMQALAIALLIFVGLAGLLFWLLADWDPCRLIALGSCPLDAGSSGLGAILLACIAGWFLFPAVAIAVVTTFTDRIAAAVERRHYMWASRDARRIGIASAAALGLRSAGRIILFNLIALPFYLLLLVTGVGPFVLFVIANGFAFGQDLGELAAARQPDRAARQAWLKATRGQQRQLGIAVSVLFLVPIANLLAPVIGTSAAIHLFNRSFPQTRRS